MSVGLRILGLLVLVAAGLTVFVRLVFVHEAVRQNLFSALRPLYKHVFNQNVVAGGCRLTLNGKDLAFNAPRVVPISLAAVPLSSEKAKFWRSIGIEHLLSLKTAQSGESESNQFLLAGGTDAIRNV